MNANANMLYQELLSLGVPPKTAIGAVGSIMGESGKNLNPSALNPRDGRNGGHSYGMGQWNEERADALMRTAAGLGTNWQDPNAQRVHIRNELTGTHKHVLERLRQADDIGHGTNVWTRNYEVPANADKEVEKRLQNATAYASYLAQNPVPTQAQAAPTGVDALPQGGGLLGFGLNGPMGSTPTIAGSDVPALPQPTQVQEWATTPSGYDASYVPNNEIMGSQSVVPPYAEWANTAQAQAQAQAAAGGEKKKEEDKLNWGGLLSRGLESVNRSLAAWQAAGNRAPPPPPSAGGSASRPPVGQYLIGRRELPGPVIGRTGLLR